MSSSGESDASRLAEVLPVLLGAEINDAALQAVLASLGPSCRSPSKVDLLIAAAGELLEVRVAERIDGCEQGDSFLAEVAPIAIQHPASLIGRRYLEYQRRRTLRTDATRKRFATFVEWLALAAEDEPERARVRRPESLLDVEQGVDEPKLHASGLRNPPGGSRMLRDIRRNPLAAFVSAASRTESRNS